MRPGEAPGRPMAAEPQRHLDHQLLHRRHRFRRHLRGRQEQRRAARADGVPRRRPVPRLAGRRARWRVEQLGSAGQMSQERSAQPLLVVELALQHAQPLVGQPAGVAPAQQLLALGVDHRAADRSAASYCGEAGTSSESGLLQQVEPAAVALQPDAPAACAWSRSPGPRRGRAAPAGSRRAGRGRPAPPPSGPRCARGPGRPRWPAGPSRRTSGAKVRPWPTSVTSTTTKAQNSSRSRSGHVAVVSGRVKIAARLITPRVPAQLSAVTSLPSAPFVRAPAVVGLVVVARRPAGCAASAGSNWVSTSHSGRSSSTTPTETATAIDDRARSRSRPAPRRPSGSCWPISRKTKPSSRKSTSRHTALVCSRLAPEASRGASWPTIRPATTTASTPETCTRLAQQVGGERGGQRDRVGAERVVRAGGAAARTA